MFALRGALALVFIAGASASSCSSDHATAGSATPTTTSIASPPSTTAAIKLSCRDAIGTTSEPDAKFSDVFGVVALPTRTALQANTSGESGDRRLFAKQGLLVRSAAAPFELIVPAEWVGRVWIGWGSPATITNHLTVSGCRSKVASQRWLAFAGGYWVGTTACVPLTIKTDDHVRTVRIGIGRACPGQQPPPRGT